MSGHIRPDDDRDLDGWVQEVTESWRLPRLRSDQLSWQARIAPSGSRAKFAGLSGARVVAALGTAAAVALVSVMLVSSLPVAPSPGPGGQSTDVVASASPTGDTAPPGERVDELFSLDIRADRGPYAADEPIEIEADLIYTGEEQTTVTSSGGGLVVFEIEQLDGPVDVGGARDDDCVRYEYHPGQIESVDFPELRLPAGEYQITAWVEYGGFDCGRWTVTLGASIVIDVE